VIYTPATAMSCSTCGSEIPGAARFCPSCGSAVDSGATLTREPVTTPRADGLPGTFPRKRNSSPSGRISSSSGYEARYVPGTTLADRYRIVSPLGKGGMGEVYRAEDLKLGQTVALKFLPRSLALTEDALERFTREVRLARQVSHPNVCRVFDIEELSDVGDGGKRSEHTFLTMEFVDGEDLASLMRRIGRLPPDKALEIARQMCAGLAAAHEHGIIHRDLKPANIMLDGRGRVRITDFGLAGIAAELGAADALAGTPAYMSPEQFAGGELTPKSDLYSLGLVLYEIFTGKRPFDATTSQEMARLRDKSAPTAPSQIVKDLDPLIERVILRCLEKNPAKRPTSALQVAAALPGGDPLAAALAAGETPSPEMVAASGESEGLRPVVAWVLLTGVLVAVTAAILLSAQSKLYRRVPLEKPPEELAGRARDILQSVGYSELAVDTAMGFYEGGEFLRYIAEHDKSKARWDNIETGAFVFWYRGSPRPLANLSSFFASNLPIMGLITTDEPPLDVSGMTLLRLNPRGRLTQFIAVPPQVDKSAGAVSSSPDWAPLFSAAGLDPSKWVSAQPTWAPPISSDARAAWTGSLAERPNIPMRIEAAAYRGKPVYFELIGPWTRPERMQPYQPTNGERAGLVTFIVSLLSLLVVGAMLARQNLRLGRGDRRGASCLAAVFFAAWALAWCLGAHHVPDFAEIWLFLSVLSFGLAFSCFLWILYIALEPYVRRRWPFTLVSWSRLLAGGFRDPLVGRDVLVGCLFAAFAIALERLAWFVPYWLGYPPPPPYSGPDWQFLGARTIIADISSTWGAALGIPLAQLFVLFLLRALLRKGWAAAAASVLFFTVFAVSGQSSPVDLVIRLVVNGLGVFLLIRFGLLALMAAYEFSDFLGSFPLTTEMSSWYAGISLAGILLMAAMAFYGFYTSLGRRPVFGGAVLKE
jgi:hypothetical protein